MACAAAYASLSTTECSDSKPVNGEEFSLLKDTPPPGISVVMDRYRDGAGHWPGLPLHPIQRREVFLRPFSGRSGSLSGGSPGGNHSYAPHFGGSHQGRGLGGGSCFVGGGNVVGSATNRSSYPPNRSSQTTAARYYSIVM